MIIGRIAIGVLFALIVAVLGALLGTGCAGSGGDSESEGAPTYGTVCDDAGCHFRYQWPFPSCASTDMRPCQEESDLK